MRFPWLQVDSDFIESKAGELGALLGISRREASGLALDLWKWCLSRSPPDRPPDGFVTGSAPVPVLASGVSWPGDPEQLVSALVEVGLVERVPEGLRVRGTDRYRATWEKNRRRPSGTKPERNRSGTAPEPVREPERKTHTQKQMNIEAVEDPPADAGAPGQVGLFGTPSAPPGKTKAKREPQGDPRHRPLTDALVAADVELRGGPYGHRGGRDAKAVSDCLALADQSPETAGEKASAEVLRRWRIARRWHGFPACNSLTDLATHWNAYVREQDAATGRAVNVRKGSVGAENFNHSHVGPVENF